MKNKLKKFLVVLCVLTCAFGLTACGSDKKAETPTYDEASVQQLAENLTRNLIAQMTAENVEKLKEAYEPEDVETQLKSSGVSIDGDAFYSALDSWVQSSDEIGGFGDIKQTVVTSDGEDITAKVDIVGPTGKTATMEYTFDSRLKMTGCVTNIDHTFAELMENAALNTLLGMGTVFCVLILISILISCFKFIPMIEAAFKKKKEQPVAANAVDNTIAQIIEKEELTDDLELVAVISAAVAAFEESNGASGDGYVVRSIKRRY